MIGEEKKVRAEGLVFLLRWMGKKEHQVLKRRIWRTIFDVVYMSLEEVKTAAVRKGIKFKEVKEVKVIEKRVERWVFTADQKLQFFE